MSRIHSGSQLLTMASLISYLYWYYIHRHWYIWSIWFGHSWPRQNTKTFVICIMRIFVSQARVRSWYLFCECQLTGGFVSGYCRLREENADLQLWTIYQCQLVNGLILRLSSRRKCLKFTITGHKSGTNATPKTIPGFLVLIHMHTIVKYR